MYKLVLIKLNDTQPPVIILIENTLDAGGFTGSRIPEQQTVVRAPARYERFGIVDQLLFSGLITD